jgi:hypothetical protein
MEPKPLITGAGPAAAAAMLGAMQALSKQGRGSTPRDADALAAAARYCFGLALPQPLADAGPAELAQALAGTPLGLDAVKLLTVMATIDPPADDGKFAAIATYAAALGIHARFLDELAAAAQHQLAAALADMTRANMDSLLHYTWAGPDVLAWLTPYRTAPDLTLAARFEALDGLAAQSFGHLYWRHFKQNGFAFPGDPGALNVAFAGPHDTVHVLTGYDTTGGGEILVSTFTAGMHRDNPVSGHILPAIFSWHLGLEINSIAKSGAGGLDPKEVWRAWAAGAAAPIDSFAAGWDFWAMCEMDIAVVRAQFGLPAEGLRPGNTTWPEDMALQIRIAGQ